MSVTIAIAGYLLETWLLKGKLPELFPSGMLIDIVGSVTGFYAWMGLWGGPYNSPSWYIALIMSMYAVFPMLLYLMKKNPHIVIIILFLISAGARHFVGQHGLPFEHLSFWDRIVNFFYQMYGFLPGRPVDWFPLCRIFEFGLGIYLARILSTDIWFKLSLPYTRIIAVLSDLAFPLFLIHYPYLFTIHLLTEKGMSTTPAIFCYIAFVFALGFLMNLLDKRIPRKQLASLITGR